jgi:lysylphosphatidylglycerol synthetase-like protein (DUF2156 family)
MNKIDPGDIGIIEIEANLLVSNILNTIYLVAGVIAVAVIIYAGIIYVTSAGDSASITKAKNTILYAVVGLVVIIMAFAITWFVIKGVA